MRLSSLTTDPHHLLNLAGRKNPPHLAHCDGDRPLPEIESRLRERLIARMAEAGEEAPQIDPARF